MRLLRFKHTGRAPRLAASVLVGLLIFSLLPQPSATALAAAAPTSPAQAGGESGVVRTGGAALHDEPNGTVVGRLDQIARVTATGRTADGSWLKVVADSGVSGWVEQSRLIIYNTQLLPVLSSAIAPATPTEAPATARPIAPAATPAPATPTPTPTQAATARPAPSATPSPTPAPTSTPAASVPVATPTAPAAKTPPATRAVALPALPTSTNVVGVVDVKGATLYDAPDGQPVHDLPVGAALTLLARNEDATWIVAKSHSGEVGWLRTQSVVTFSLDKLPFVGDDMDLAATALPEPEDGAATAAAATPAPEPLGAPAAVETAAASSEAPTAAPTAAAAAPLLIGPLPSDPALQQPRPTPVPDGRPTARIAMTDARLNIRSGPGTAYAVVAKALPNDLFVLIGRNEAGDWLQVELTAAEGGVGWLNATFVETSRAVSGLPVVASGAPLAPAPSSSEDPLETAPALPPTPAPTAQTAAPALSRAGPTGLSGNLVFQDGNSGLFLLNLDAGDLRFLTSGYDPAISPDGRTVAFTRGGGADNGIYTIGIDGSNERKIWGEGELLRAPKWSPDGERIVFSRLTGSYKCYDIKYIGCMSLKQLISEFPFLIFPEARRRFLSGVERLEFPNWGLSRIASDGSGAFRDIAALDSAVAPDWNEAGILYQSTAGLEVTEDTPTGDTRSILAEDWDHDPDWQPGGGFVLFQSKEGSHWEIWRITPEGTGMVALTHPQTTLVDELPSNVAPAWSPDGQHIVYLSSRRDDEGTGPWRLWVMDADGGNKRVLPVEVPIDYSFAHEQVADWGPAN